MANTKAVLAGMAGMLLAACSAMPSPPAPEEMLNQRFAGHKAALFFQNYGTPASKTSSRGGTTYHWVSIEPAGTETQPVYRSYPAPGGTRFPMLESGTGVAEEPPFCGLAVQADKRDIIHHIAITYDSTGKYSNSLCAEIFR